jgi:5-methylthioadenosine/S-adenosylhomocysteine deaminase
MPRSQHGGPEDVDLLLDGGTVITVDAERRVFRSGAVAITGDRITGVARQTDAHRRWSPRKVIDTADAIILPGLVCTHSHGFQVLYRGLGDDLELFAWLRRMIYPLSAFLGAEETYAATLLCCMDLMKTGTTTFADSFYIHVDAEAYPAACRAAEDSGIRAVMGRASLDQGEAPARFKERPRVALQRTDEALRALPWEAGARVRGCVEGLNTHSTSAGLLRDLKGLARDHGTRFHMHAAETRREAEEIRERTGKGVFEFLDELGLLDEESLFYHAVWTLPHEIDLLRRRRASVSHNPISNSGGSGVAPIPAMVRRGVKVALGVDGAASNNGQDMLETMKFAALIHPAVGAGFLSSERIVEMATIDGARALGLDDEIGSLEAGKKADVIVIGRRGKPHLSPGLKPVSDVVFCANGSDVDTVVVGGDVLIRDRRFTRLDEEEATRRVADIARRMVRQAKREELLRTPTFHYVDRR